MHALESWLMIIFEPKDEVIIFPRWLPFYPIVRCSGNV